ncbi:uncharacterized protein IWZ02DRAFT_437520 [Phyllosticta citriasiana]|uniref:uncharacterized protein n=1 Tax=Phyllosticta citriasiana TaxID=595635 RepID=UPI0030FD948D
MTRRETASCLALLHQTSNRKQAKLGIVNLDKDHPLLVKAMLEICYTDRFDENMSPLDAEGNWSVPEEELQLCLELYAMAHRYQIELLENATLGKVRDLLGSFYLAESSQSACITPLEAGRVTRRALK